MTRIWMRTVLFTILGALVFVLVADNSADACHRRHRRRCNGCNGSSGDGYAYGGKYGGAYYGSGGVYSRGTYGAPVAPYGEADAGPGGARSARGTIEGDAGARVDGSLRSPSDRARGGAAADIEGRAGAGVDGAGARARAGARGDVETPPPPPSNDTLPPPSTERPAEPSSPPSSDRPAEPSAPPSSERPAEPATPPASSDEA